MMKIFSSGMFVSGRCRLSSVSSSNVVPVAEVVGVVESFEVGGQVLVVGSVALLQAPQLGQHGRREVGGGGGRSFHRQA